MWYIFYNEEGDRTVGQFGHFFKTKRIALGKTLRQFCLDHELDPGNVSKLERGLFPPPQHEKLQEYANLLGLKEGTDDWYQFFDLAAAESGKIPQDILNNEQVVEKLPLFFRTLRGKRVPDEMLNQPMKKGVGHPEKQSKIKIPKKKISGFCRRHHIRRLALFGSVLRDDFHPASDVDVLVEFEPGHIPGLIRLSGIEMELTKLLKRKVDLRTPSELSPYFRNEVLKTAQAQYDAAA